jgi:hypothetical protein
MSLTMRKVLLALALLGFGLGPALAVDSPSDDNSGGGNDPPSGAGGKSPGQTNNPNPGKLFEPGPAWLSEFVIAQGCCTQTNGGGNTPGGNANGVPNTNNGGNAPPGQQGR